MKFADGYTKRWLSELKDKKKSCLTMVEAEHENEVERVLRWQRIWTLTAIQNEMYDFTIQVLYSLCGECAPRHDAAPYTDEELCDMARKIIKYVEEDS